MQRVLRARGGGSVGLVLGGGGGARCYGGRGRVGIVLEGWEMGW